MLLRLMGQVKETRHKQKVKCLSDEWLFLKEDQVEVIGFADDYFEGQKISVPVRISQIRAGPSKISSYLALCGILFCDGFIKESANWNLASRGWC
jgi:hypothetical protein